MPNGSETRAGILYKSKTAPMGFIKEAIARVDTNPEAAHIYRNIPAAGSAPARSAGARLS